MQFKQKLVYTALAVVFLTVGLLGMASITWAEGYGWTQKADMPTATSLHAAGVVDGKIYVIGGTDNVFGWDDYWSTVFVYDPATDTWARKTDMPTARARLCASVVDGKLYAIGGSPHREAELSVVEVYDPATDTWTKKADMPRARNWFTSSVVDGKIYAIGGKIYPSETMVSTVEEYDPLTDTWTRKADMPAARARHAASVVDGKIYVIGGSPSDTEPFLSTVEVYDPVTDAWTKKADMPTARGGHSASTVDGKIYVIGGMVGWVPSLRTMEVYDPAMDTWTKGPDMPTARATHSASVVDGRIYVIGGMLDPSTWSPCFSTVEKYDRTVAMEMECLQEALVSAPEMFSAIWVGQPTTLEVTVELPVPLEETELFRRMSLDLSPLGILSDFPLEHMADGRYTVSTTVMPLGNAHYDLPIMVETVQGERYRFLTLTLDVYPAGDMNIYKDGPGESWTVEVMARAESDLNATAFVRGGSFSHAILLPGMVKYAFDDADGINLFGYDHLEFWINGGSGSGQDPVIAGMKVSELGAVPKANTWTLVSIPVSELSDPLTSVVIGGRVQDTFYIDDMKLVAAKLEEPITAVEEVSETEAVPRGYTLSQNVPNPFNPVTMIGYGLPKPSDVTLTIYTITGQKLATVVSGHQEAGRYTVAWDGSRFGTGIYFYGLEAGSFAQAKRMLFLK